MIKADGLPLLCADDPGCCTGMSCAVIWETVAGAILCPAIWRGVGLWAACVGAVQVMTCETCGCLAMSLMTCGYLVGLTLAGGTVLMRIVQVFR